MSNVAGALETAVTPTDLWANVTALVPFVGILIVFGFGYYLVRKVISGARHGKAKI